MTRPKPEPAPQPAKPYTPTPADLALMRRQDERAKARHRAPRVKLTQKSPRHTAALSVDHPDQALAYNALVATFGTVEVAAADWLLGHLLNATHRDKSKPVDQATLNGALATLHGLAPRDEAEAMLCAQMIATHAGAMEMLRSAMQADYADHFERCSNFATKLLRTYTAQMEALKRYRSGGEQKMTVEHVHVHAGGKAIVGPINSGEGAGVSPKPEDQPHAKQIAYAPEPAMPGADPTRDRVPVSSSPREAAL
jgi:hypothetical protein